MGRGAEAPGLLPELPPCRQGVPSLTGDTPPPVTHTGAPTASQDGSSQLHQEVGFPISWRPGGLWP